MLFKTTEEIQEMALKIKAIFLANGYGVKVSHFRALVYPFSNETASDIALKYANCVFVGEVHVCRGHATGTELIPRLENSITKALTGTYTPITSDAGIQIGTVSNQIMPIDIAGQWSDFTAVRLIGEVYKLSF